jgi:hypothetical protein
VNKFAITPADRIKASKRGHRASVVPQLVGNVYMTYWEMADKLGVSKEQAEYRFQKARKRGIWPITLSDLGA